MINTAGFYMNLWKIKECRNAQDIQSRQKYLLQCLVMETILSTVLENTEQQSAVWS